MVWSLMMEHWTRSMVVDKMGTMYCDIVTRTLETAGDTFSECLGLIYRATISLTASQSRVRGNR